MYDCMLTVFSRLISPLNLQLSCWWTLNTLVWSGQDERNTLLLACCTGITLHANIAWCIFGEIVCAGRWVGKASYYYQPNHFSQSVAWLVFPSCLALFCLCLSPKSRISFVLSYYSKYALNYGSASLKYNNLDTFKAGCK